MAVIDFDEDVLLCPSCQGNNLHHARVEVFNRDEDADRGIHLSIDAESFTMDDKLDGNPSKRRNGIKIKFWCEHCDAEPVLSIAQHKGLTLMEFS